MAKSKTEVNFMEHLKPLLPAGGDASELEAAAQALAGLSPEDRDLLAAVQESPYRLTTLEQFREFPANTEYFVLEPNIRKVEDVGWRYLAQHWDDRRDHQQWPPWGGTGESPRRGAQDHAGEKALYSGAAGGRKTGVWVAERPGQACPAEETPRVGRLMSRSKKWRLEWAFFLGENGRRQYNKLCKGCVHPCKQSFRAVVVSCPHYLSRRSKKCGN